MKIRLRNFQGHVDSTVELNGGITAVTGSTNAGKSSIIRAILQLRDNNLRGTQYIRKGTSECIIELDNVSKLKNKTKNEYHIGDNKLEVVKTTVPPDVTAELNLSPDCIQSQHDAIFLLGKSPGYCAQKFSELVDLDAANAAVKLVDQERKSAFAEQNTVIASINAHQTRLEELRYIKDVDTELQTIEKRAAKIDELTTTQATLQTLIKNATGHRNALNSMPDVSALSDVTGLIKECRAVIEERTALHRIKKSIDAAKLAASQRLELPIELCDRISSIGEDIKSLKRMKLLVSDIKELEHTVKSYSVRLKDLHEKHKDTLGSKCPMCGSILND